MSGSGSMMLWLLVAGCLEEEEEREEKEERESKK